MDKVEEIFEKALKDYKKLKVAEKKESIQNMYEQFKIDNAQKEEMKKKAEEIDVDEDFIKDFSDFLSKFNENRKNS